MKELVTDEGAEFDVVVEFDVESLIPQVTWGTSPGMGTDISSTVPNPADFKTENERKARRKRWSIWRLYQGRQCPKFRSIMSLSVLARMDALKICVRQPVAKGHKVSSNVTAIVVPGSGRVKIQAEQEGLDKIFVEAGFEWREAGRSMCLAMNPDVLKPGQRAHPRPIVTSKDAKAAAAERISYRRQWRGTAVKGRFVDVRDWNFAYRRSCELRRTEEKFMQAFTKLHGIVAPVDRVNVDTDAIIPKQF